MLRIQDKKRLDAAFKGFEPVKTPIYNAFSISDFQTLHGTWSEVLECDTNGVSVIPVDEAVLMLVEARRSVLKDRKFDLVVDAIEGAAFEMATNLPVKIEEEFQDQF